MDPRTKAEKATLVIQALGGLTEDEAAEVLEAVFGPYAARPAKLRIIWDTDTPRVPDLPPQAQGQGNGP